MVQNCIHFGVTLYGAKFISHGKMHSGSALGAIGTLLTEELLLLSFLRSSARTMSDVRGSTRLHKVPVHGTSSAMSPHHKAQFNWYCHHTHFKTDS